MREIPALFQPDMVSALLAGIKTQTRRPLYVMRKIGKSSKFHNLALPPWHLCDFGMAWTLSNWHNVRSGDVLWVREAWRASLAFELTAPRDIPPGMPIRYEAGGGGNLPHIYAGKYRPPMFMPRWASRISLLVTRARIERLQQISESDAIAEGVDPARKVLPTDDCEAFFRLGKLPGDSFPVARYAALWDRINGETLGHSWHDNPWVVVTEFEVRT